MRYPGLLGTIHALPFQKYRSEIKRYVLLLFIPILLLILLFAGVRTVTTRQMEKHADAITARFRARIDAAFQDIEMVSDLVFSDSIISRHLQGGDQDIHEEYTLIRNQLANMARASSTVAHIYIIREDTRQIISDEGLISPISFSYFLNEIGIDEQEYETIGEKTQFTLLNKYRTAPYGVRKLTSKNGDIVCTLIVTLDMNYLLDMFNSQDAELCAIFNDDMTISSYLLPIDPALFGGDFQWTNPRHISTLLGKPVMSVYSEMDGYTTLVALSSASYYSPLMIIGSAFVVYAVTALLLGFVCLFRISKRRYDSIARMAAALPDRYAGDDSYDHIYEKVCASLKDSRSQNARLIAMEKEQALRGILLETDHRAIPEAQLFSAGLTVSDTCFYVLSFFVDHVSEPMLRQDQGENTHDFLNILVRTTVTELAAEREYHASFTSDRHVYIAVLSGTDPDSLKRHILSLCRKAVDIITSSYDLTLYAAVSSGTSSASYLPESYRKTVELHSFARSVNSTNQVLSGDQMKPGANVVLSGDFVRQKQILLNTLLARKYDLVPPMLESILNTHVITIRKNYTLVRSGLQSVASDLIEGVRISGVPGLDAEDAVNKIVTADSVQALIDTTRSVYGRMDELNQQKPEIGYVNIALTYMTDNLSDQNLNVAQICEATGISVQRLTRMFQEKFNMPVGEYMNTCRIEKAKHLLVETDTTVGQIALDVGYTNINTLTRNFKKREGITPTDYRRMHQSGAV